MSPEKVEELKLKQKFPQQVLKGGQSHFLQKRLQQRVNTYEVPSVFED